MPTFEEIEAMTRPDSGPLVFDFDSLEAATRPQSVAPPLAGRMGRIAVEQGLQQPGAEFIAPQPDAPVSGYMEDIGRGLTRGVPEISRQIGGALEAFTPFETTRDAGRRLRTEAEGQQSLTPAPQTIPGQIAQSVPSLAAGIGAGVAGAMAAPVVGLGAGLAGVAAGAGVAGVQSGGGAYADALERLRQRGITGPEAEADARAGAGAVAIVSAITNTVPIAGYLSRIAPTSLGRAMDRIAGNVAGRLVLQAAAEGSQEAVEEFSVIVAQDLAENDPEAYRGLVGRIGTAALGGAVLGGGARAGMDVAGRIGGGVPRGTIVSENPEKDIPESEKPISGGFGRGSGPLPLAEPSASPDTAAGAAPTPEPTLDDVVAALRASRVVPVAPPQPEPQPVTEIPLSQQVEAERGRQVQPVVEQRVAAVEQVGPPAPILPKAGETVWVTGKNRDIPYRVKIAYDDGRVYGTNTITNENRTLESGSWRTPQQQTDKQYEQGSLEPQDAATAPAPSPTPKRGSKRVRTPDALRPVGGVPTDAGSAVPLDQGVSGVVSERGAVAAARPLENVARAPQSVSEMREELLRLGVKKPPTKRVDLERELDIHRSGKVKVTAPRASPIRQTIRTAGPYKSTAAANRVASGIRSRGGLASVEQTALKEWSVNIQREPGKAVVAESGISDVPEKKFSKASMDRVVEEISPGITSMRGLAARETGAGERALAQTVQQDESDHRKLIARVFKMDQEGRLGRKEIGSLVGINPSDMRPGDTFQIDGETATVDGADESGVTINVPAGEDAKGSSEYNRWIEAVGGVPTRFKVPPGQLVPANQGTYRRGGGLRMDKSTAPIDITDITDIPGTDREPTQQSDEYVTEEADAESLGIPESLAAAMPESGAALEENESGGFDLVFERPVTLAEGRKLKSAGWVRDAVNKGRYFYESKAADKPQVGRTLASKPQEPSPKSPAPAAAKQPWEMTGKDYAQSVGATKPSIDEARHATDQIGSFAFAGEKVVSREEKAHKHVGKNGKEYVWDVLRTDHTPRGWKTPDITRYLAVAPGSDVPLAGVVYNHKLKAVVQAHNAEGGKTGVVQSLLDRVVRDHGDYVVERPVSQQGARAIHRHAVNRALREGKPVPESVLADYPDLAGKAKPPEADAKGAVETDRDAAIDLAQGRLNLQRKAMHRAINEMHRLLGPEPRKIKPNGRTSQFVQPKYNEKKQAKWEADRDEYDRSVLEPLREAITNEEENVDRAYAIPKPSLTDKLSSIEQAAKERRESRRIKRGKDTGSSTLPEDAIDFIIETSAGAAKDLVLTAQAIRQYVAERIPEKFRGQLDQIVAAITRAINSSLSDDKKSVVPSKLIAALKDIDKENKFGRPDLANPGTSPAARQFVDTVDEARKRAGQPERKADVETQRQAAKIEDDEAKKILRNAEGGGQLSDEQTIAAKRVVDNAAREALTTTDRAKRIEAAELVNAYRQTGTEQARAFRQRRDETLSPVERQRNTLIQYATEPTPKLAEAIDSLTDRIKRASTASEKLSLIERRKKLLEDYADENQRVAEALQDIGLNPATMTDAQLSDRRTAARVVRTINSAKATPWHWAIEWWINAILSGPPTQIVNAAGNAAFATWDQTVQKLVESSVNLVAKDPNAPTFGEIKAAWSAFLPSLSRAGQNFLLAWDTEMPVFADDIATSRGEPTVLYGSDKLDIREGRNAIPGKTGRIVRIPTRTLLAVDELFKTIVGTMEANAAAYRMAKEEGLSGEAAYTRAGELVKDLTSPLWDKALEEARKITFQSKLGKFGEGVLRIRNDYPALTFILPFVSTPLNIFKAGIRKTPFSVFLTMHRAASHGLVKMGWSKSGWNYDRTKVVDDLSDNLIGLALLAALMPLVGDDENEPWITGSGASDSGKRALQYRTAPPQSIRMGDKWVSYSRIEPFATAISISTDLANALAGNSDLSLAERAIETFKGQIKDKTFLSGVSDIMEVFQDGSPGISEAGRFASNFAASWVPNVVRSTARASDPFQREARVWGSPRDAAFWEQLGGRTLQRAVPIPLTAPPPKYDLWGRPIKAGGIAHPAADFLYRAVVPFGIANDTSTKPDRVIVRWNSLHPDSTYAPRPPTPYITKDGKRIPMTDQQYADFTRKAGSAALARLERVNMNEKNPTERDMAIIKKIIEEERSIARKSALQ